MDNRSAREMLGALPIRMNEGGDVNEERNKTLLEQEAAYLANPSSWTPETAYNAIIESGISVQDALDAGVKQSTIDMIFTAPAETPAYSGPAATAPMAADVQTYYDKIMDDGAIDAAERLDMQKIATDRGLSYADIVAAGVDPNILYQTTPAAKPVTPKTPVTAPIVGGIDPFPAGPATPAPDPFPMMPDTGGIYAAGQPALDEAFRASAPRTEVIEDVGGQQQLTGFDYTPAAKLLSATGSGFSFTPPSVTSRPRSLMGTEQLGRFQQGRAAQEFERLKRSGMFPDQASTPFDANAFNQLAGSYGSMSRSQLNALMRQQGLQNRAAQKSAPSAGGTIAEYIAANPDIQADYERQKGQLGGQNLNDFARNHYNTFGKSEMAAGTRAPFTLSALPPTPFYGFDGREEDRDYGSQPVYTTPLSANTGFNRTYGLMAEGGPVKKPKGFADGGSASADLKALDPTDPLFITETVQEVNPDMVKREIPPFVFDGVERPTGQETSKNMLENIISGAGKIPESVANYFVRPDETGGPSLVSPRQVGSDVAALGGAMYEGLKEDPVGFALDVLPVTGEIRSGMDVDKFSNMANEARAAGDTKAADLYEQIVTLSAAGTTPIVGMGARATRRTAIEAAEKAAKEAAEKNALTQAAKMLDEVEALPTTIDSLSRKERGALNKSAGRNPKKRELVKSVAENFKNNYRPQEGWAPVEIIGAEFKGNNAKIKTKKIPYAFQNPPAGVELQQWKQQLSDGIVTEVEGIVKRAEAGDQAALDILGQANWYRGMRNQLRSEFGGLGDVFADVLGTTSAQTNVEQNFANAVEIMRKYSRGDYDAELAAYAKRVDAGERVDGKTLTKMHKAGEFPLITKDSGALFNTNSPSSMGALLNMFRTVKAGAAPKTPNFTGNLIGLTNEATVDVWAARMLRRLSGQNRIPPSAEQGVTGTHLVGSSLLEPKVGGEFGFGQEVFRDAANRVNQSGSVQRVDPNLGALGPDDLQAIAWFIEKEQWAKNGWTTKSGEGGSLEYEMSFAGAEGPERVVELRRQINQGFKTPKKRKTETDAAYDLRVMDARTAFEQTRREAQDELTSLSAPLQRFQLGVAGERPNQPMSNYGQAELAAEFDDVVREDPSVLTYNLANTYGSFMGDTERSLNAEFVVRENFDPQPLRQRLIEQGKQYDQDAVFLSKVVPEDTPDARPGVEIYFKETITPEQMATVTERLRDKGVDGFTYVTDMRFDDRINRQTRPGDPETAGLNGLRFQYVPEFDDTFDPQKATESYNKAADLFRSVVNDTVSDGNVSDARITYYDTEVYFRDDYDEQLSRTIKEGSSGAGGDLSRGANDPQSNRGAEVGTELSTDVPDGIVQKTTSQEITALNKSGDPLGINIAVDKNGTDYADLIVNGTKKFESRETASLKPYVGKRVGIVRTGAGPAEVIGSVEIGQPIEVNEKQFNQLRDQHLVAEDSSFNIKKGQTKFLYPMVDPTSTPPQKVTSKGIVARAVPESTLKKKSEDLFELNPEVTNADTYKSRNTLITITPDEFLNLAPDLMRKPEPERLKFIEDAIAKGEKLDAPFLYMTDKDGVAKVTGHEGRHRAEVLKKMGINEMPVVLKSDRIRWGQQNSPFDKLNDKWPTILEPQDPVWSNTKQTGKAIPFPVPSPIQ